MEGARSRTRRRQALLNLEDAVAPGEKDRARTLVVDAVRALAHAGKTVSVRINAADSPHAYRDVLAVAEAAGDALAPRTIGIEAQIEDAGRWPKGSCARGPRCGTRSAR